MFQLVVTAGASNDRGRDISEKFGVICSVDEPLLYERKAFDRELQQFVQFVGSLEAWNAIRLAGLTAASTVFLAAAKKFGDGFGEDGWKELKRLLRSKKQKSLFDLSEALLHASTNSNSRNRIRVGLNQTSPVFGTLMEIGASSTEEIAFGLSQFVLAVADIHSLVVDAIKQGDGPLGSAQITIEQDGWIKVSWMSRADLGRRVHRIYPKRVH